MVRITKSAIKDDEKFEKPALWFSLSDTFMIHKKLLESNILLIKYSKTYAMLPWLKRTTISDTFKNVFLDIIDTGTINYDLLKKSTYNERDIFNKVMHKCRLSQALKYDESKAHFTNEELVEQFNIIKGEIIAGNNNKILLIELKTLMHELVKIGKITQTDFDEIMLELEML